jgi:hypothetical protein
MKFTRAIALCGLTLAIALAIGAITPMQPYASAGNLQPIFSTDPERVRPTPALATTEPTAMPIPAAPVIAHLPPPTQQVIYVEVPAAPAPQIVYIQAPAAPVVEQPAVPVVEQPAVPVVEQPAAPVVEQLSVEQPATTAGNDYQQRRLDAINSGAAYRPKTR